MPSFDTESEFQLRQMYDILCNKLVKRGVDISCLEMADPVIHLKTATQVVTVREGIDSDVSRKMVKLIKDRKLKVQAAVKRDQLPVISWNSNAATPANPSNGYRRPCWRF